MKKLVKKKTKVKKENKLDVMQPYKALSTFNRVSNMTKDSTAPTMQDIQGLEDEGHRASDESELSMIDIITKDAHMNSFKKGKK